MPQRLELAFDGGTLLRLTVEESAATALLGAFPGDDWRSIDAEEGTHWINMDEVLYIRVVPREPGRVGFGGGTKAH